MIEPLHIQQPLLFIDRFNFDAQKLQPIIDELISIEYKTKVNIGAGDQKTSFPCCIECPDLQPHFREESAEFIEWLGQRVREIMSIWADSHSFQPFINNSWFNVHNHMGVQNDHVHPFSYLSVAAYIKVPPNSGNIEFVQPDREVQRNYTSLYSGKSWIECPINSGDVLFFPSWLRHRTQPNMTHEDRIVWSINISLRDESNIKTLDI